jgi:hypothetical protein
LPAQLTWLDVDRCKVGNEGAAFLAAAPALAGLRILWLSDNSITEKGAKALASSPHLGGLQGLHLSGNRIGKKARQTLVERFGDEVCDF